METSGVVESKTTESTTLPVPASIVIAGVLTVMAVSGYVTILGWRAAKRLVGIVENRKA